MPPSPIEVLQRWFNEIWNGRREATIDELLTSESVCHTDGGPLIGPEGFKERIYRPILSAFPDLNLTVEEMIQDGSRVVVLWSATGTHTGPGIGIPPTGRTVQFHGTTRARVADGKLMEGWQTSNLVEAISALAPYVDENQPADENGPQEP